MTWGNRFKQRKAFKKELSKKIMLEAQHPKKWWDWCVPKDKKKEIEPFFIDGKQYKVVGIASSKKNTLINY